MLTQTDFDITMFYTCGYSIMVIMSGFQPENGGSIPPTRSRLRPLEADFVWLRQSMILNHIKFYVQRNRPKF